EVHELYLDELVPGTAVMSIEEDDETDVRFHTRPIGEIAIDEDDKQNVDTVSRQYDYSAHQIILAFGDGKENANIPDEVKKSFEKGDQLKFDIIHMVLPRQKIRSRLPEGVPKSMPVIS